MNERVRLHYEKYHYPHYSLLASVRPCDTYALNRESLWARFNGKLPPSGKNRILLAGCGSFSPYPTSLANPKDEITALDLSRRNLSRAKIHALLHGCFNITWEAGDLLDNSKALGEYGFIDSFGVIHHLEDPLAGLRALEKRLAKGGIMRLMVYSNRGRREAESVRKAFRLLGIKDVPSVRRLIKRADKDSRFYRYVRDSHEATFDGGLADAFLHPCARTFRIDELMTMIGKTNLSPLLFAHTGALPDVSAEVERLCRLEKNREAVPNFIIYVGRETGGGCALAPDTRLMLNPVLRDYVGAFRVGSAAVAPRLGFPNPVLDAGARRFLRKFRRPVMISALAAGELDRARPFLRAMFLFPFRQ
ncbi:MAG: hypothetical protein FD174_3357 [Geobacteraceae bacterium]|nr:MAG: hypothetical protein FD174_3357 [Geobacteraceae bacterium]